MKRSVDFRLKPLGGLCPQSEREKRKKGKRKNRKRKGREEYERTLNKSKRWVAHESKRSCSPAPREWKMHGGEIADEKRASMENWVAAQSRKTSKKRRNKNTRIRGERSIVDRETERE